MNTMHMLDHVISTSLGLSALCSLFVSFLLRFAEIEGYEDDDKDCDPEDHGCYISGGEIEVVFSLCDDGHFEGIAGGYRPRLSRDESRSERRR